MADFIKAQAVKMAINLLGPETIQDGINSLINQISDYADKQPLEADETQVAGLLYKGADQQVYFAVVAFNDDNKIVRYIEDKPINHFAAMLLSNLKNM